MVLKKVMKLNEMTSYSLSCESANSSMLSKWLESKESVDVLDVDIQGAELKLLTSSQQVIDVKVKRLIVGTHSQDIHDSLKSLFTSWIVVVDIPLGHDFGCLQEHLRRNYNSTLEVQWDQILENNKCYHNTSFGPVANWDGELILDNPKFVRSG